MANCFLNASYDPSHNGTCPFKVKPCPFTRSFSLRRRRAWPSRPPPAPPQVAQFRDLGFERENALREFAVPYPFY